MILVSIFVAATLVTLLHYVRARGVRALPLAAMFAFLGMARVQDGTPHEFWWDLLAAGGGLAHLALLVPRHAPEKEEPAAGATRPA